VSLLSRLYRGEIHWDFVGNRRRWFTLSLGLLLASVLALSIRGLNLSVDFVGGTLVELPNPAGVSVGEVRDALADIGFEGARVQTTGAGEGVRVQTEELDADREALVVEAVASVTGADPQDASAQSVGPTFGSQIAASALRALIVFLVVVAVFISIRLEWKMAAAGLAALGHDLLLTAGIYALVGFEVTPATIIAILTILGYSLYDTVVVFDKVVENVEERGDRHTASAIVNMSMNQVFMRSVNTSLTSLLPIGSLLFVGSFLLGATTLRQFALALFIGVATGTYSSIFLAAPLLALWKEREEHWQRVRRRMQRRGTEDEFAARILDVVPETEEEGLPSAFAGAVPRPPKKRRRRR
jgi:preprotein translocase subunit SecF